VPSVRNGDVSISYQTRYEAGETAPFLVMVFGIGGASRDWWEEFPAELAKDFRLVMIDNRGTGESDRPQEPWSMDDMVGDITAVLEQEGVETFHLLGCSLGSMIVRHWVKRHGGGRIRSLSLLCAPNGIPATEEDQRAALFWDPSVPLIESARKSWQIVHPSQWALENDAMLAARFAEDMKNPTPARTFQFQLQAALAAGDANDALNDDSWPVLVLHGDSDRLVPPANAETLHAAVPCSSLVMLPGASHNFWSHAPAESAAAVREFLHKAERENPS
jgi:3-oxoadipate enol-lactonase